MGNDNRKGKTKQAIPSHWPLDVVYISHPQYAPEFPIDLREQIQGKAKNAREAILIHESTKSVIIRRITKPSHPAYGQNGLFALRNIQPNSLLICYVGELHTDERPSSDYDLSLLKTTRPATAADAKETSSAQDTNPRNDNIYINVGIDAEKMGNEARFINDYRGTGVSRPNAFFRDIRVGGPEGPLMMSVWSGKDGVKKGDEILVSYGKGWWTARNYLAGDRE